MNFYAWADSHYISLYILALLAMVAFVAGVSRPPK